MSYTKHDFKSGEKLYAQQLNEMDEQIFKNTEETSKLSEDIANLKENGTGGGAIVSSVEPETDDIPKVFFSEAIPQTKDDATTAFRYISKTEDISGYAEFKAQGNSSMSYPKKNMTVKMYSDEALSEKLKVDFKEWGKQAKHVYKANWIDLTHARNIVSARLWADVVKSRTNYAELPELLRTSPTHGAVDGFPVKVYSKGIYQGRYTLNIPKDAWMANMDDSLDNHCILCGENYDSGCFRATANINGNDWSDEVHDTVPASIKTRWNEVISFVMNSTDEEFVANLENYFFVDSLIDYFIFGMVSCGLDAFGKNQLYFTYDGIKWIASMYDMDSTWGLYWNGSKFVSANYTREEFEDFTSGRSGNLLYIRLASLFYERIQLRYAELKDGALSIPNIINRFERFTDIASLDLVKEDYASTTGGGKFTGIPSQTTNNIQQIRKFVVDRYAYCDEYIASLSNEEPSPDIPDVPDVPDEPIIPDEPLPEGYLAQNYSPNGASFSHTVEDISLADGDYIEAKIDLSTCANDNENVLSVGKDIAKWDEYNYHLYYVKTSNELQINVTSSNNSYIRNNIVCENNIITIKVNKTGMYLNDSYVEFTDTTFFKTTKNMLNILHTLQIGSQEGIKRSNATYEYIKVVRKEVPKLPEGAIYSLPQATIFNGISDYIDTGVNLNNKPYTILLDYETNRFIINATILDNMNEEKPYPGWAVDLDGSLNTRFAGANIYLTDVNANYGKIAIRCTNDNVLTVFSPKIPNGTTASPNLTTTINHNLLIGAYYNNGNGINRFFDGAVYKCAVYDVALSDEEILGYLSS